MLFEMMCLKLPPLYVYPSQLRKRERQHRRVVVASQPYRFDRVEEEVRIGQHVPDIVMWKGDRKLLVEIFGTHRVDEEKRQWLVENNLSAIEVWLNWGRA